MSSALPSWLDNHLVTLAARDIEKLVGNQWVANIKQSVADKDAKDQVEACKIFLQASAEHFPDLFGFDCTAHRLDVEELAFFLTRTSNPGTLEVFEPNEELEAFLVKTGAQAKKLLGVDLFDIPFWKLTAKTPLLSGISGHRGWGGILLEPPALAILIPEKWIKLFSHSDPDQLGHILVHESIHGVQFQNVLHSESLTKQKLTSAVIEGSTEVVAHILTNKLKDIARSPYRKQAKALIEIVEPLEDSFAVAFELGMAAARLANETELVKLLNQAAKLELSPEQWSERFGEARF